MIYLDNNMLNGSIPSSLMRCPLQRLDLSYNSLVGSIPRELFFVKTLSDYMRIKKNLLTRTLPMELGNLNNLGELDFSGNQLSREIPVSLGAWQSLQYLNASQNNLQGTIPVSVEQMKGLFEGIRGGYASAKKISPQNRNCCCQRSRDYH
jgi:Leucine-rich repeat (LRR) protein